MIGTDCRQLAKDQTTAEARSFVIIIVIKSPDDHGKARHHPDCMDPVFAIHFGVMSRSEVPDRCEDGTQTTAERDPAAFTGS